MDRSLACDGIDELYIDMLANWARRNGREFPRGSLHLHCTDGDGEWLVVAAEDHIVVTHEHAKGDVAWRGSAVSLILSAWGRTDTGIEIFGDANVSDQWLNFAP
jgi:predicted lipid carrier protein YhbT